MCHNFFNEISDEGSLFNHLISSPSSAQPLSARVGTFGRTHRKLGRQIGWWGSFQALWRLFCEAALFKHNVGSLFTCAAPVQSCIPQSAAKPAQCPRPPLSSDPHVNTTLWAAEWTSHTHHTQSLGWWTRSTETELRGLKFHTTLASSKRKCSRKSQRSPFPFILFTSLFQEPEPCINPSDGEMWNAMSCTVHAQRWRGRKWIETGGVTDSGCVWCVQEQESSAQVVHDCFLVPEREQYFTPQPE